GQNEALYAIQWSGGPTGSLAWPQKKVIGRTGADASGDQMVSTPILGANGVIYVGAKDAGPTGTVYALSPADGSTLWSYTTGNLIQSSPALGVDGTLYIGSFDDRLYAFALTKYTFLPASL